MGRKYCEECGDRIEVGNLCKKCKDDPVVVRRRLTYAAKDPDQTTLF